MLKKKFEELMKFDTEFGGAEPPTEPSEPEIVEEIQEETAETQEETDTNEGDDGGAEPPNETFEMTENVSRRINKIREEAEERVRQAKFEATKQNESFEFLQVQGSINPYTGNVIDNFAEYRAYKKMFEDESNQFNQAEPDNILELVEQKVSEILTQKEMQTNANNLLKSDIAKISRVNPNIKTIADVEKLPEASMILEKVVRGYTIYDAYVTSVKTKTTKPKEDTTGHMTALKGGVGSAASIPANVLQDYKNFGYTEKQAIEDYEKMMKGK